MEKITDFVDQRFKHQTLLQDYQNLLKETKLKMKKLEMMRRKRSTLEAEVRFLRRRYKDLKQDQSLETNPNILRLSEAGDLEVPGCKRKKISGLSASVPCFDLRQKNKICNEKEALADNASRELEKKPVRSRASDVLTESVPLPDLNTFVDKKVPGFDLNLTSREEEEPEASGEQMVAEATKNAMGTDLHGELKLPICRDMEKELNRGVKRKVTWQDPVALSV